MGALLGMGGGPFPTGFLGNWGLLTGDGEPVLDSSARTSSLRRSLTTPSFTSAAAGGGTAATSGVSSTEGSFLILEAAVAGG